MSEAKVVGRICSGCGAELPPGAGAVCPACGKQLIELRAAEDAVGSVIDGRFEVRSHLGRGGMGSVYACWQRDQKRDVALKLIDARIAADAMGVRRFLREARLTQQLGNEQTVRVLDFGQTKEGRLFIAMELLRGRTLADLLDTEAPLPIPRAVKLCLQLCDALEAAHGLGILHRDLKPSNAMVLAGDKVKILDFGLAKSLREDESQATSSGLVMGTPGYIAPELMKGEPATVASDLYAVGVILGEMVTGRQVWGVAVSGEMRERQKRGMPAQLKAPLPVRPVLDRLLSPLPSRRPQSAAQLRALLMPLLETPPPLLTAPPIDVEQPQEKRGNVAFGLVALALLFAAGVYVYWHRRAQPQEALPAPQVTAPAPAPAPPPVLEQQPIPVAPPVQQSALVPAPPEVVTIHVDSDPVGALVVIEGRDVGITPADLQVKPGAPVMVEARLGDGVGRQSITPTGGESLRFTFSAADVQQPAPRQAPRQLEPPPPDDAPPDWEPGMPPPRRPPPPPPPR
jgi:serine/threonine-protein kinase